MTSRRDWLDHVRFMVHDPFAGEFTDPLSKTHEQIAPYAKKIGPRAFAPEEFQKRSIPTIVTDDFSAEYFDPLTELTLELEMMLRRLFDDSDEVVFGEPMRAKWLSGTAPTA